MIRRLKCWLFHHDTFSFPNGTTVCRRCWKWWRIAEKVELPHLLRNRGAL